MSEANSVSRKGTCIIKIPEALIKDRPVDRKEIIDGITKKIDWKSLVCVQLMPTNFVRITFKSEQAKDIFIQRGLCLRGVAIAIQDADPRVNFVFVHHLPAEVSDQALTEMLKGFGKVLSCQRQFDKDYPTIETGSRIVRMVVEHHLPPRSRVMRYPCRFWYREQPKCCRICLVEGHLAVDCPMKGKCLRCGSPDHMVRDCANAWGGVAPRDVNPTNSEVADPTNPKVADPIPKVADPDPTDLDDLPIVDKVADKESLVSESIETDVVPDSLPVPSTQDTTPVAEPLQVVGDDTFTPPSQVPESSTKSKDPDWSVVSSRRKRGSKKASETGSSQRSRSRTPMRDATRTPSASPVRPSSQPASLH